MQSYAKDAMYHYLDYTCITYGTVPCIASFSSCTIIVSWRSVWACFTNDPLPIQIGQEYFIELVKCNFQGGWLKQLIRSNTIYELKVPKTKCIRTLGEQGLCLCWPLSVERTLCLQAIRSVLSVQGFKQELLKTFLFHLVYCPMN